MLITSHHSAHGAQDTQSFSLQLLDIQHGAQTFQQMVMLDARPKAVWQQGHLPGAYSFCWVDYTRVDGDGVNYRTFPDNELAAALGVLGIDIHTNVLIYGDADSSWGGEGWLAWMLASLGHQGTVYVLDGGIQAWEKAQLSVSNDMTALTQPASYQPQPQSRYSISAKQIDPQQLNLIDSRNYWTEWLPGHLPNAVHIDWKSFSHGEERRPIGVDALKKLLTSQGVDLSKPVVYYCSGGIRSGYCWMVHQLAGLPDAINFEGGTEEWKYFQAQRAK